MGVLAALRGIILLPSLLMLFIVFYAGAVIATGRAWYCIGTGLAPFSALRDLTGISDRAALRRLFGLTLPDGSYRVTWRSVLKHRRPAGVVLCDLPVHALFFAALLWAASLGTSPITSAIICAAALHATALAIAAIAILAGSRRVLTD
jgi:hypothetical protein